MVAGKKKTKATAEVSIFLQPHDIVNKKKNMILGSHTNIMHGWPFSHLRVSSNNILNKLLLFRGNRKSISLIILITIFTTVHSVHSRGAETKLNKLN